MIRRLFPALFSPVRLGLATFLLLGGTLARPAYGQAAGPVEAAIQQADGLFDRRQYKEAAAAYASFLQAYPNSEYAVEAQFHLAYADFLTGDFEPAADLLLKLQKSPTTPAELQDDVGLLLPQVYGQAAAAATPDVKQSGFETAIKAYDDFITKFPKSPGLEAGLYGKAVAEYQLAGLNDPTANYAAAAADLKRNLTSFPNSETVLDSEFLLAITVGTQSNLALADEKIDAAGRAAALKGYEDAENNLRHIVAKNTDISLTNDAQFQLGETLMAHVAASPIAARAPLYRQALAAYRAVEPKAPMIVAQTARVDRIKEALVAERRKGAAANRALIRQLDQLSLRESGKLGALAAKEDPVLSARLKCGAVFYSLERYDETRALMAALLPGVTKPEDQKLALYYIAMTYTAQKQVEKAVKAYDTFQAAFSGDAIAENLPLAVASLFATGGAKPDPEKAKQYNDDFGRLYPNSRFRDTALLQQANTSAAQGNYDEALKTLDTFLQGQPKPEVAASAELARATFLQGKGDNAGAVAAYTKVRDTYKGRPEAEQAAFGLAVVTAKSGDATGAVKLFQAFVAQFPQSKTLPSALLNLAQAQQASGAKDQALATLTDVAARFPQGPEAANAFFQRANIYLNDHKYDDMSRVLTEFVDKYPASDMAFAAYERIASVQAQANQPDAAAATYQKFVSKQPDSPHAPEALTRVAQLWLKTARAMGSYVVLAAAQRDAWNAALNKSIEVSEQQVAKYPKAAATALGLQTLLDCQRLLIVAKTKTPQQVTEYFQALADKFKDEPGAHSRILFRLASLTAETDPAKALADMRAAYSPDVVYSPADIDQYATELMKTDAAATGPILDKLAHDYPVPAGVAPAQAAPDVQEAQATVLYGRGQIAQKGGNAADAQRAFAELKKNYPRSAKVPDANLGLAEGLVAGGKGDEALPLLADVAKSQTAPLNARARALFLNGKVQQAKGQEGAIDAFLKVAAFYPTSPDAAEGLWLGAQALEKQAATLSDTPAKPGAPTKTGQLARARKAYQDLVARYGSAPWADQAKERLSALPPPPKA